MFDFLKINKTWAAITKRTGGMEEVEAEPAPSQPANLESEDYHHVIFNKKALTDSSLQLVKRSAGVPLTARRLKKERRKNERNKAW